MKLKIGNKVANKVVKRLKKKVRIRKTVSGTNERPRLSVYKSARHMYAQLIDDTIGVTLVAASTREKGLTDLSGKEAAKRIGAELAKRALSKNLKTVVFDRNGYPYHGRVQSLADSARETGLIF